MTHKPIFSIVIANYNYGCFLEDAIRSVASQGVSDDVELIICDAASTDNSVEIIKKYARGLPANTPYENWRHKDLDSATHGSQLITWWCSEKDGGQSAAFNKGFSHANGLFLTWLNADDILLPGALKAFKCAIKKHTDVDWFGGGCLYLDPNLRVFKCARSRRVSKMRIDNGEIGVTGPSSFFSRRLYDCVGGVDERFQYSMDTDLWTRFAVKEGATYVPFVRYAWGLRLHPGAKMSGHKFTKDGQILDGKESREAFLRDHKRLEQLKCERAWTAEHFTREVKKMSTFKRLLSADFFPSLMSRYDSWRFKGREYNDVVREDTRGD